jgi:hypothetical protein
MQRKRNCILLTEGTGQGIPDDFSNVTILARSLVADASQRIHLLPGPGVGTAAKISSWAFGAGVINRVVSHYEFLSKERETAGDNLRIFIFGFSRGALASRYLADIICNVGIPSSPHLARRIIKYYRTNEHDGLDTLAEAFVMLKKRATIPNLKLRIGGGCTDSDKKFLSRVKDILRPYIDDVIFEDDYSPALHHKFYSEVSLISVPLRFDEGVGIYICEAYATSRPVVEPRRGSFPEIVGDAGVLYDDESATGLANALEQVLTDKKLYNDLRENTKTMAQERYSDRLCAEALMELYSNVITQATSHKQD